MSTKRRTMRAWCGFENGRPDAAEDQRIMLGNYDMGKFGFGLFRHKSKAADGYEDVRRVTITWDAPAKSLSRQGRRRRSR